MQRLGEGEDLHWQAHVYGTVDKDLETACRESHLPFTYLPLLRRNALYLVRPDGYISLASFEQSATKLKTFVEQFHLRS